MEIRSKICDAADWFDPELLTVIQQHLQEVPRFHRKQWEFATIFLMLQKLGLLTDGKTGLSMGGGKELLLYAIARQVKKLIITDLYDPSTEWDCARTGDPDEFIKMNKPFPVDDSRLQALRMDMRQLEFKDETFDFCYSSCAIEHIGSDTDFRQHLQEACRVLKPGGIYVLTTEFQFDDQLIRDTHNYVFPLPYLKNLIHESSFKVYNDISLDLSAHKMNYPLPGNFMKLSYFGNEQHFSVPFLREYPHILLLRGKYPFTSILLILQKEGGQKNGEIKTTGLDNTQKILAQGIQEYRQLLSSSLLSFHPFSANQNEKSRYYADHAEFFQAETAYPTDDHTIFHTDYFWLGSGRRKITVEFTPDLTDSTDGSQVEIRIHRFPTLASSTVDCQTTGIIEVTGGVPVSYSLEIETDDNYCYAILGKLVKGNLQLRHMQVFSSPN